MDTGYIALVAFGSEVESWTDDELTEWIGAYPEHLNKAVCESSFGGPQPKGVLARLNPVDFVQQQFNICIRLLLLRHLQVKAE